MIKLQIDFIPELDAVNVAKLTKLVDLCFPDAWRHTYDRKDGLRIVYKVTRDWSLIRHDNRNT